MNLIYKYNVSSLEDDMQRYIAEYFSKYEFHRQVDYDTEYVKAKVYREVRIPNIGRISDVVVQVTPRKIFNIECKNNDVPGVIEQAIDHLYWADYSYICVHANTYIASRDIKLMMEKGIGLLLWHGENEYKNQNVALMDVLGAVPNTAKNGKKNPDIRNMVMDKLKKIDSQRIAASHIQLELNPPK